MTIQLPMRPSAHQIEDESIAFLLRHLPVEWTCDRPQHDYGVDLRIGLASEGMINGQQFVVQLKASVNAGHGDSVAVTLEVPTLNYLRNLLEVVLIIKYVATERDAYWLLLKDYTKEPSEGQKTATIRIPRENSISAYPWHTIAAHVQAVHSRKLRANVS